MRRQAFLPPLQCEPCRRARGVDVDCVEVREPRRAYLRETAIKWWRLGRIGVPKVVHYTGRLYRCPNCGDGWLTPAQCDENARNTWNASRPRARKRYAADPEKEA